MAAVMKKLILILFCVPFLVSCSAIYPVEAEYVVLPIAKNHFRIEFFSDDARYARVRWLVVANELCNKDFYLVYSGLDSLKLDLYTPIAGREVNIGQTKYIRRGEVICNSDVSSTIHISESQWREFNRETKTTKPVSARWLSAILGFDVEYLERLSPITTVAVLAHDWGAPVNTLKNNYEKLMSWFNGSNNRLLSQVALLESNECLAMVLILPGVTADVLGQYINQETIQADVVDLLTSGLLPAYSYRTDFCSAR